MSIPQAVQFHRLMGNELAYRIVRLLGQSWMRPSQMAKRLKVSRTAVSNRLRLLGMLGLIDSYSTGHRHKGREVQYWLIDWRIVPSLEALERRLKRLRRAQ